MASGMKPSYTTIQFKYGNALNASSRATPKVHIGERKDTNSIQTYIRQKTALKIKELDT